MQPTKKKLDELIESLSKKQRDDLHIFINLPSLNFNDSEKKIFINLVSDSKKRGSKNLDIEDFRTQKKISKKEWNYIAAKITNAIYQYLSMKLNPPEEMPSAYPLARYFRTKGMDKNYRTLLTKMEKNLTKNGYSERTENYYRSLIQYLLMEDERNVKKNPERILDYQKSFDNFYFENKLRIACELLNRGTVLNLRSDTALASFVSNNAKEGNSIAVRCYYDIFKMYSADENNEKHYEEVKELIARHSHEFSPTDRIEIYEFLMNFCIALVNQGKKYYAQEYLNFIEIREAQNLILNNKKISETKYNNIISVMLLTDNLVKAEEFIYKYAPALDKSIRENAVNFNLAQVKFQEENFDEAHDLITNFEPHDFFKKIKYDKLLLKIYFEKGAFQLLESKLKTFKKFIQKNKKLNEDYQVLFLNFGDFLLRLSRGKPISRDELKNKVTASDFKWLSKKTSAE